MADVDYGDRLPVVNAARELHVMMRAMNSAYDCRNCDKEYHEGVFASTLTCTMARALFALSMQRPKDLPH